MAFPNWGPSSVVATTVVSTFARDIQSNLVLMQNALKDVMGAGRNVYEYTRLTLNASGNVATAALLHEYVSGITASQHHDKSHAATHIGGTDDIPLASTGGKGLMSSAQYTKLYYIVTGATPNPITVSTYIGTSIASKVIALGYKPKWVNVWRVGTQGAAWEGIQGCPYVIHHKIASQYSHDFLNAASSLTAIATGFKVLGSVNATNVQYTYMAVK